MQIIQKKVIILLLFFFPTCNWCRCIKLENNERNKIDDKNSKIIVQIEKNNLNLEKEISNSKRFDNIFEKAILRIMTGNLTKSDLELLKSLNYSSKEIFDFQEQKNEMRKKHLERRQKIKTHRNQILNDSLTFITRSSSRIYESKENEFEEYNRQAVYDYENMMADIDESELEISSSTTFQEIYQNVNKIMKSQITFKSLNDSEFNSFFNEKTLVNNISKIIDNYQNSKNVIFSKGTCKFLQENNSSILCSFIYFIYYILNNNWNDNLFLISQEFNQENNYLKELLFNMLTMINRNFKSPSQNISNSNLMDKKIRKRINSKDDDDDNKFYSKIMAKEISYNYSKDEDVS